MAFVDIRRVSRGLWTVFRRGAYLESMVPGLHIFGPTQGALPMAGSGIGDLEASPALLRRYSGQLDRHRVAYRTFRYESWPST